MAKKRTIVPTKSELNQTGQALLDTSGETWAPEARKLLEEMCSRHSDELISEAFKLAKRDGVQQVGLPHVKEARSRVFSRRSKKWVVTFFDTIGGILLGSVAGMLHTMGLGHTMNQMEICVLVVLTAVGSCLALFHALKNH